MGLFGSTEPVKIQLAYSFCRSEWMLLHVCKYVSYGHANILYFTYRRQFESLAQPSLVA